MADFPASRTDLDRLKEMLRAHEMEADYALRVRQGRSYEDAVSLQALRVQYIEGEA